MLRHSAPFLVACAVLTSAGLASDSNYYVSNACQYDGNGLTPACATSAGGSGARNNLQAFLNNTTLQPGDTVFIRAGSGDYITSNTGGGNYRAAGFNIKGTGASGSPITIRSYPGETPTLASCANGTGTDATCSHATVTATNTGYLRITGLKIRGGIRLDMDDQGTHQGYVVDNNEILQGAGGGGNWSALFLGHMTAAWVYRNYIHDISPFSDYGYYSSDAGSCLKLYTAVNSMVEWNTFDNCSNTTGAIGAAVHDKQDAVDNIYRYNKVTGVTKSGWLFQAQKSVYDAVNGLQIHHNLIVASSASVACFSIQQDYVKDYALYNNTCIASEGMAIWGDGHTVTPFTAKTYNNIYYVSNSNEHSYYASAIPVLGDYNVYTASKQWCFWSADRNCTPVYSVADLRTLATNNRSSYAQNSSALTYSASAFGFVSASTGDYRLTPGSQARMFGRVGGVSSGATVDAGCFEGPIQCVGHLCPSGLAAPTGVAVRK
jgi:hypothetical protein